MAAQKKVGNAIAILTLLLNPRDARKSEREVQIYGKHRLPARSSSERYTAMGALIDGCGS
jgi:hypothetical protein